MTDPRTIIALGLIVVLCLSSDTFAAIPEKGTTLVPGVNSAQSRITAPAIDPCADYIPLHYADDTQYDQVGYRMAIVARQYGHPEVANRMEQGIRDRQSKARLLNEAEHLLACNACPNFAPRYHTGDSPDDLVTYKLAAVARQYGHWQEANDYVAGVQDRQLSWAAENEADRIAACGSGR